MNRKLIKLASIFFIIMISFTVIARASSNFTTAKVSVVNAISSYIDHSLSLEGTIKSAQAKAISTLDNQLIESVNVKEGEIVTTGTPLFCLDTEELKRQIATLTLEIEQLDSTIFYEKALQKNDEQKRKRGIQRAEEDLALAMRENDQERIQLAKRALEDALDPLVQPPTSSAKLERIQKNEAKEKLLFLQKNSGQVLAPFDAVIVKLGITAGDRTTAGTLVVLSDFNANRQFVAQTSIELESELRLDSVISITGQNSMGQSETLENVTISSITVNRDDKSLLDIFVDLPNSNFGYGSTAKLDIVSSSQNYDCCLPLTALRQMSENQYFILVIEEVDTIMGRQNCARKILVNILDKNEQYVAVESDLIGSDSKIIASTTKVIDDGSRVKVQN